MTSVGASLRRRTAAEESKNWQTTELTSKKVPSSPSPSPPVPPCCNGSGLAIQDLIDPTYAKRLQSVDDACRRWGTLWTHEECNPVLKRRHIHSGYLDLYHMGSCPKSLLYSLCSIHNETGNIYTHLLPGLACVIYLVSEFTQVFLTKQENKASSFALHSFLLHSMVISMIGCFICSSIYHIGRVAWPHLYPYFFQLDLIGIWCLVTGSFICGIYVGYECYPFFQSLYLVLFGAVLFSIIPLWFIFPHKFPWKIRQMVMVLTIASGIIPCLHWMLFATWTEISNLAFGAIGMFFFYGLGFVFFYYRIPERFAPGKFDIWLHSHQFWHLFVATAALIWWWSLDNYINWRITKENTCHL